MSLDKAIKHGKEHRKPYRKSQRFDKTCRCHGACSYCRDNRTKFDKLARLKVSDDYDLLERDGL